MINKETFIISSIFNADDYFDELRELMRFYHNIKFNFHWRVDDDPLTLKEMIIVNEPNSSKPADVSTLLQLFQDLKP